MKTINQLSFLVIALLAVLADGCSPVPIAPTNTPSPPPLSLDWLLTADEINSISKGIGVFQWELKDTKSDEYRVCHYFQGQSDSFYPNQALNCVYGIAPGTSFDDVVSRMHKAKLFFPDEILLPTSLVFEDDFGVFGGTYPNGQLVYDLLLYKGGLLHWVSVTLGRYSNESVEDIYKKYTQETIDTFLNDAIIIHLEKRK